MRLNRLRLFALIATVGAVTACASNMAQETVAEVFGGPSQTVADDLAGERFLAFDLPENFNWSGAGDPALTVGGRLGIWFSEWGGVALDGSNFQADGNGILNDVVSATPLFFLRARLLKSDRAPDGHLQPYVGIGPGLFFTDQEAGFRPDISGKVDLAHVAVGVDLRAGMRWQLSESFGFFGEYRLTHYDSDGGRADNAALGSNEPFGSTRTTNRFMGGLSLLF